MSAVNGSAASVESVAAQVALLAPGGTKPPVQPTKSNGGAPSPKPGHPKGALELEIERLRAENEALKAKNTRTGSNLTLRVSEKGAVSAYGLGRFPVTLYREQWEKLLAMKSDIEAFIAANEKSLSVKERS